LNEAISFGRRNTIVENDRPVKPCRATLLIVKTSLLEGTWEPELKKHVHDKRLKVFTFHGNNRHSANLSDYDIVLTTYGIVYSEQSKKGLNSPLYKNKWFRVVLDEAHEIRNRTKGSAIACRMICSDRRWALSGTPIQNSLHDFGSLVAFLKVPGLETAKDFVRLIIEPFFSGDGFALSTLTLLRDTIQIRRLKSSVLLNLPPQVKTNQALVFEPKEQESYNILFSGIHRKVAQMEKKGNSTAPQLNLRVFALITKLRRFCTHKKELLGESELKYLEAVQTRNALPAGDKNEDTDGTEQLEEDDEDYKDDEKIKNDALAIMRYLYDDNADNCEICTGKIIPDGEDLENDNYQSDILCRVLRCGIVICDDCFPAYEANLKLAPNRKRIHCEHCKETHPPEFYSILRSEFQEHLEQQRAIKRNKTLSKSNIVYTGYVNSI
jgi:SNF2 family DNA or RNA helicase